MTLKQNMKTVLVATVAVCAANVSFGYEMWYGMPYMPKNAGTDIHLWETVAPLLAGMNSNFSDAKRDDVDRNTTTTWRLTVSRMTTANNNVTAVLPRPHFDYDGKTFRTLEEALQIRFDAESRYGLTIKWLMIYNERPNEDPTKPVVKFTDEEISDIRDWLDTNGHSSVKIAWNQRNNSAEEQLYSKKALIEGILMEGSTDKWHANTGSRQDYLLWALGEDLVKNKPFIFQTPFSSSSENIYVKMRTFARWLSTSAMLGSTDFIRRDDVAFMIITYQTAPKHLPEKNDDGTQYVNTMLSTALSLIEQKSLFEGRNGLISLSKAEDFTRDGSGNPNPTSGLVAHWPLDEGAGTTTADVSGYDFDGDLLNGVTWGSDAERGTYAVFDGTDDRIETTFSYALADTNDFTWAWWAKKEPASHANSIMVGNRYGNSGSETYEFIKMTPPKGVFANTDSTGSIENYNYTDIAASSWHHYAMVKSGTSFQWYVDGVAQGAPVTINYSETTPIPFLIGGDDDGSGTKVNEHFEGCIDDVVLYREALTPGEVVDVKNGNYPYGPPVIDLIAGWDTWDTTSAPAASFAVADVTASATASATGGNWSNSDGSGRGSSKDTTWGTYDGGANPASAVTTVGSANFTLTDGKTDGEITFTMTNTGTQDIVLDQFHFDAVAFRPNAARTYALNVLAGSDITVGNVFTSADDAITSLAGNLLTDDADPSTHDQHDDIDIDLSGLADHTLEAGETASIQLAFSSGTGSGGGHHLFVDNAGISGVIPSVTEPDPPVLEMGMSGGNLIFSWTNGSFKVQSRTNLTEGIWQDVPGGDTPPVTNSVADPACFYRLIEQ